MRKICLKCKHEAQWHTNQYGCLAHPPGTELLESVCGCNEKKDKL